MKRLIIGLAAFLLVALTTPLVAVGTASAAVAPGCDGSVYFLGFPTWYRYLDIGPGDPDGSGPARPVCDIIGPTEDNVPIADGGKIDWSRAAGYVGIAVIEILLRIAAIVAVGYVIYGGFRYITSQGEPDATKSARQTIINAIIGLVIALIATVAVSFVASQLTGPAPQAQGATSEFLYNMGQLS